MNTKQLCTFVLSQSTYHVLAATGDGEGTFSRAALINVHHVLSSIGTPGKE